MYEQPRDENGNFVSMREVKNEGKVKFLISEYECRVIGNRMHRLSEVYKNQGGMSNSVDQECNHWSGKFLEKCSLRKDHDDEYYNQGKKRHVDANYMVKVSLTGFEAWSLGNRLFEVGNWYEEQGYDRVAVETKWLARRVHAEWKEQVKNADN